jgi:hypothetical protein
LQNHRERRELHSRRTQQVDSAQRAIGNVGGTISAREYKRERANRSNLLGSVAN